MDTFECVHCGGAFPTDDEHEAAAKAEAETLWGSQCEGPMVVLCDDCFSDLMGRMAQ